MTQHAIMNEQLFRFINDTIKCDFLDRWLPLFSDKNLVVLPGVVLLGLMLYFGRRRARTCVLALVLTLTVVDASTERLIKNFFGIPRPYARIEGVNLHRGGEWVEYDPAWYDADSRKSNAFPSSHAGNAAGAATVLALFYPATAVVTVPVAFLVSISRIYTGNHMPFDVLAGSAYGLAWGLLLGVALPRAVRHYAGPEPSSESSAAPLSWERKAFHVTLGAWTLINSAFVHLNLFSLAGDEAQYWDWSRRLALGYYSKPPLIAYFDALLAAAGGNQEWALRTGAVLLSSLTLALIYALALRIARNERSALLAAVAALAMPASWAGSFLMTIDPLLILFWTLAMYAFHRAVSKDGSAWWWVTGLALGLGMLSKYTAGLLVLALMLYLVLVDRKHLRAPGPYIAAALALLCMSGVLYWNWANDWVSVRHTASIGAGEDGAASLAGVAAFAGGQLGVVSPILLLLFLWAMWRCALRFRENRDAAFLTLCFATLFVFYLLVSFYRRPQPNWPAAAWVACAIALGWVWGWQPRAVWLRRTLAAGIALGMLIGIALRSSDLLYLASGVFAPADARTDRIYIGPFALDPDADPTNELRGGHELAGALKKYFTGVRLTDPFLFSDRYQLTAQLAFYAPGRPRSYCMNPGDRRYNQYDLWGGWEELKERTGIFVTGGSAIKAAAFVNHMVETGAFERGEILETVEVRRHGVLIKQYILSRLVNFSGKPWTLDQVSY